MTPGGHIRSRGLPNANEVDNDRVKEIRKCERE